MLNEEDTAALATGEAIEETILKPAKVRTIVKDGIHPGMSRGDYSRIEAANWSTLRHFKRTAAHARYEMLHPSAPTEALEFGTAFHCAVLEPEKFADSYVVAPKVDRRTKLGKDTWTAFENENRDKMLLEADDMMTIKAMREALLANDIVKAILSSPGKNEIGVVWTDPITGQRCKGLIDRVTNYMGWTVISDFKTTEDAGEFSFGSSAAKYGYHGQGAFYLDGFNCLAPLDRRFLFVAVEKKPPYGVAIYELEGEEHKQGEIEFRRYLAAYAECKASNRWPCYPMDIRPLAMPFYSTREASNVTA